MAEPDSLVKSFSNTLDSYLHDLSPLLMEWILARLDHAEDENYEVYGERGTFYGTLIPEEEFAGLLSSWLPDQPSKKVILEDDETPGWGSSHHRVVRNHWLSS